MFKPVRDVLVVKKTDAADRTKGGIFIPATVDDKTMFHGVVVACGDGILTESGIIVPLVVKQGDKILFGKTGCLNIQVDGEDFVMMRENNVIGVDE